MSYSGIENDVWYRYINSIQYSMISKNNPANIRYSNLNKWKGLEGHTKGFCNFESTAFGVRALIITLRTYIKKHGLHNVEDIINRFAPSSENNTRVYISYISNLLCINHCKTTIEYGNNLGFILLVVGICYYETHTSFRVNDILSIMFHFKLV